MDDYNPGLKTDSKIQILGEGGDDTGKMRSCLMLIDDISQLKAAPEVPD